MKCTALLRTLVAVSALAILSIAKAQTSSNPYYIKDSEHIGRNYYYYFSSFAIPDNLKKAPQPITLANNSTTQILIIDQIDVQVSNSETVTFAEVHQIGPSGGKTITKGISLFPIPLIDGYGYAGPISHRYVIPPGDVLQVFLGRPAAAGSASTFTVGTILFTGYSVAVS